MCGRRFCGESNLSLISDAMNQTVVGSSVTSHLASLEHEKLESGTSISHLSTGVGTYSPCLSSHFRSVDSASVYVPYSNDHAMELPLSMQTDSVVDPLMMCSTKSLQSLCGNDLDIDVPNSHSSSNASSQVERDDLSDIFF